MKNKGQYALKNLRGERVLVNTVCGGLVMVVFAVVKKKAKKRKLKKINGLRDFFGSHPDLKASAQEIKDEARKNWQ